MHWHPAGQSRDLSPAVRIPKPHGTVVVAGGQQRTVGTPSETFAVWAVSKGCASFMLDRFEILIGVRVPDFTK